MAAEAAIVFIEATIADEDPEMDDELKKDETEAYARDPYRRFLAAGGGQCLTELS